MPEPRRIHTGLLLAGTVVEIALLAVFGAVLGFTSAAVVDTVPGGWRDTAFLAALVVDLGLVVLAGLGIAAVGRRWRRG